MIVPFIPAYLNVVRDPEDSAVGQRDRDDQVGHDLWDDFVFEIFGVHKGEGVVVMHYDGVAESPEIEEGAVDYV